MAASAQSKRALDLLSNVATSDGPTPLVRTANLALAYWSAGRTAEAIPLQEQVLADSEGLLGPRHPDTIRARANVAFTYRSAQRTAEAIVMLDGGRRQRACPRGRAS